MVEQSTIQSFDWGALQVVAELNPDLPWVALTNHDFLQIGEPGASPWLGGLVLYRSHRKRDAASE